MKVNNCFRINYMVKSKLNEGTFDNAEIKVYLKENNYLPASLRLPKSIN